MLRLHLSYLFFIACFGVLVSGSAAQTSAFQEMQQGRQALNQGKYDDAIQHFEKVIQMNPSVLNADLYLGAAYQQKYVPGVDKGDNIALAKQAIQYYQTVLDRDAFTTLSLPAAKGIALLYAQMNKFDEARESYVKVEQLAPKDPQPFYYIAVIDWTLVSQSLKQERTRLGLKPTEFLADKDHKACIEVRGKNWSTLDDGIENLNAALKLDPNYEEAITYMNLIYLERADVECDDPGARKSDLKTAAEWTQKLQVARTAKATRPKKKEKDDDDDQ
jgi:tetratricopeptide (TPR) repeat protein